MTYTIIRGDALHLPLDDASVDLVVTSNGVPSISGRHQTAGTTGLRSSSTITGYACACPDTTAPTTPAVVLDPFGGTGTTALVAHALGRHGISVDMSADYCRLAEWRCNDPAQLAAALQVDKPAAVPEGQLDIFGGGAA